ncbi:biosynthetic-type acetolactate synthase large subunit [Dokdonella sp.]|uniref:biosynthetic-type acetolactate synthase large subunit n=1 Tax=Dokdonella sp. TaxID=2291710 RepID=UPI0025B8F5C6|nr:biosynthetic-type acetolactate synthase large subunit [Dokdonella sp.]MBX3693347.1 biosynthetic-type acetolactate synthase large subunit [Dokdonella sp.]MCW5567531.1 biosynthetic-type acetolactate synthase large subunit [Dokdonella sp.]
MNAMLQPGPSCDTHALAGTPMSGADIVVQVLADEGVDVVFGYSGGAILPVYDAVFRYNREHPRADGSEPLPLIVPANEQGAGFMAQGYARASGKVGVALVTSGPGATNTVTPVRDAMADSVPIVVICGQIPTAAIGTDAFQEAPISSIMGSCAKHVFLVTDAARLEATLRTAFEIARTGRPGPVVIDIPKDVQNAALVFAGSGTLPVPGYRARLQAIASRRLGETACARFFDAFERAERPLLYVGGGVIAAEATASLRAFAKRFGVPVTTTLMGLGAADTTEALSLHMLGMHGTAFANYAVEDCDFVIAVGARFDDRVAAVPDQFAAGAKFIAHFDVDPAEIDKVKRVNWHHLGDLADALDTLRVFADARGIDPLGQGRHAPWHAHIAALKRTYAMNYDRGNALIQPYAVIEAINRITRGNAIIATGVGQHQMWAAQYFDFTAPRRWLTSGSMGTMGFGLPAAIGAQFARRDMVVIDIDGDASIRMNLGELETVTTYGLPVKVVVLNNCGDGMVRQWQKLFFKGRFSATDKSLHKKDFIKAAAADGFAWARRLENPAEVDAMVADFIAFDGPAFLEVMIDPDAGVYPMVGPGMTYAQMITGDHIPSRSAMQSREAGPSEMF